MESQIDQSISTSNYTQLLSTYQSAKQSYGQGNFRTFSAYIIQKSLSTPSFLPKAFSSPDAMSVFKQALSHLPTSVPNAADNKLRHALFNHLVEEEEDYRSAASILSSIRMETNDENSVYYTTNAEKTDVYVKIAECFLYEEDYVEAETFVTKAGSSVESIESPKEHMGLILRFKSTYARVLDANRKFVQAASRYYDLSQVGRRTDSDSNSNSNLNSNSYTNNNTTTTTTNGENENENNAMEIDEDDLLEFLGRAATCAILAPSSSQRQRILGLVYKDNRLTQLDSIPHFKTHSSIVTKMYKHQIIQNNSDLTHFVNSLNDYQKAIMSDGLTIEQRALIEHNMVAVSRLYKSIYFDDLGLLLGVSKDKAEKIACKMIVNGNLVGGSVDEVDGILNFDNVEDLELVHWDGEITSFCMQLNKVTDSVRQNS